MLNVDDRRARLEELLERIGRNRGRPAGKRPVPEIKTFESVPPPSPISEVRLEQGFAVADSPAVAASAPRPARKVEPRSLKDIVMEGASSPPAPYAEQVARFETRAAASGDVAVMSGARPPEWTLDAVLERAWKLGAS